MSTSFRASSASSASSAPTCTPLLSSPLSGATAVAGSTPDTDALEDGWEAMWASYGFDAQAPKAPCTPPPKPYCIQQALPEHKQARYAHEADVTRLSRQANLAAPQAATQLVNRWHTAHTAMQSAAAHRIEPLLPAPSFLQSTPRDGFEGSLQALRQAYKAAASDDTKACAVDSDSTASSPSGGSDVSNSDVF